jgi:DNA-binding transcriptional ArsR family regulator
MYDMRRGALASLRKPRAVHKRLDMQPISCLSCSVSLDVVFKGLADTNRRKLLDRLHSNGGQTLSELCDGMGMARQSVSKHLAVLEAANLVVTVKRGREKLHYLNPVPIAEIYDRWIGKYERSRMTALVRLREEVEDFDD